MSTITLASPKLNDSVVAVRTIASEKKSSTRLEFNLSVLALVQTSLNSFSGTLKEMKPTVAARHYKEIVEVLATVNQLQAGLDKDKDSRMYKEVSKLLDQIESIEATLDALRSPRMAKALRRYEESVNTGKPIETVEWNPNLFSE